MRLPRELVAPCPHCGHRAYIGPRTWKTNGPTLDCHTCDMFAEHAAALAAETHTPPTTAELGR